MEYVLLVCTYVCTYVCMQSPCFATFSFARGCVGVASAGFGGFFSSKDRGNGSGNGDGEFLFSLAWLGRDFAFCGIGRGCVLCV